MNRFDIARLQSATTHQTTTFDGGVEKTVAVARGETIEIARADGSGFIAQLWLTFPGWFWRNWDPEKENDPSILKTLILRIYWDGEENPAVAAPVGDFFGVGLCETANFAGHYFGMSSGGFFCCFPMPFRSGFRIEVENRDARIDTAVYANVLYQISEQHGVDDGYFHAHFTTGENAGPEPLCIADVQARGHYAGCTLSMQALRRSYLGFLEAPEHVYVDDDWDLPRFVGSGLEDYFLGGWYFRDGEFCGPLHGLPVKDALNSTVAMYRVHEADAVHFRRRFRMQFVNPFRPKQGPFRYSSVAFFYLDSAAGLSPEVPGAESLLCWYRVRDRDHQSIP